MSTHKPFIVKLAELINEHWQQREGHSVETSTPNPNRHLHLLRWLLPNGGTLLIVLALILTQQVWARTLQAPAAPGPSATTVNYQGRLANNSGGPLSGNYGMSFALYSAATGGSLIWGPESHVAVPVSNGLFSVGLGSQTAGGIPTTVWNGDRYLEITVGGETLSPRELIRSVPIAGMALTVPDGAISSSRIANAAVTRDKLAPNSKLKVDQASYGAAVTVSSTEVTLVSTTISVEQGESVLLLANSRAVFTNPGDELYFHIYRDGIDLTDNIHMPGESQHQSFSFSRIDPNLTAGTHTYVFTAKLQTGAGNRYVHQPSLSTIVIP